jgi:predicted dehydrogenase
MKIAVLGAGHLGSIHIRLLQELSDYELVGFYDPNTELSNKISKDYAINSFESIDDLIANTDVVDIVTPTLSHFECAKKALAQSKHVFIEKPVTNTIEEADELLNLAAKSGVKVQVGHVERFNPAFTAAKPYINKPMFIETHRLAAFNPRGTDVSVVLDLMIHDIDIILHIVQSKISSISTSGVAIATSSPDITNARIEFENGCVANLTASRVSLKQMRKTRIFQKDAYISVDFLAKKTEVVRIEPSKFWDPFSMNIEVDSNGAKKAVKHEKPLIKEVNAIQEELRTFAQAIQNNNSPLVTLHDGCEALKVAHTIMSKINRRIDKIDKSIHNA